MQSFFNKRLLKIGLLIIASFCVKHSFPQLFGESQKQVFKAPGYEDSLAKHKTVAILPFNATISYKRVPKGFDANGNKADEQKLRVIMQQGMYTYLLQKSDKFAVSFQDVERTNILLKQARIFDSLEYVLPDSLAKILHVDGIIKCSYAYEKTGTEAGAIAKTLLFGAGGKTGSGALVMQIYHGFSGELMWRFYKEMNEGIMSNANEVMERMMKKVARNFPYAK